MRLTMVTNRAPYTVRRRGRERELVRNVGGLSVTLDDALRRRGGVWLAWSGSSERGPNRRQKRAPLRTHRLPSEKGTYRLKLLGLTEAEVAGFYHGVSNRSLWPLCHYFPSRAHFDADDWDCYVRVNRIFARAASRVVPRRGVAWIHDFQLALVPQALRALRPDVTLVDFWHIPFPAPAVLRIHPDSRELMEGLLGCDLIGFHTTEYAEHFLECAETFLGATVEYDDLSIRYDGRVIRAGVYPLGVETAVFTQLGGDRRVLRAAQQLRQDVGAQTLLLGVDRLDYTKGIPERLRAYEKLLLDHPELHGKICFVQIQVPSREAVPEYRALREQIDRTMGRICGRFSTDAWVPVRYLYRGFSRRDLAAYYRAADVLVVTPLRDGMNLVAQEFVATRVDEDGVLLLSEFAGAAERLGDAILVNPYDVPRMTARLHRAIRMRAAERHASMRLMRRRILAEDVNWWLDRFLADTEAILRRKSRRKRR